MCEGLYFVAVPLLQIITFKLYVINIFKKMSHCSGDHATVPGTVKIMFTDKQTKHTYYY